MFNVYAFSNQLTILVKLGIVLLSIGYIINLYTRKIRRLFLFVCLFLCHKSLPKRHEAETFMLFSARSGTAKNFQIRVLVSGKPVTTPQQRLRIEQRSIISVNLYP